jgi:hypothetical protein
MAKKIRVIYEKLGRSGMWGHNEGDGTIHVDERLKGKKLMEIIIHECIHELWHHLEEEEVEKKAAILARTMWHEGYRKIDNHDKDKMQDE